ncbi:MAG: hypothetical protein K2Z81_24335, partial [Cyanobacteria bacterium]|nr:hypothetical protein [Cyanobacteriota bacterium]
AQELAAKMPGEYAGMVSIAGCLTTNTPQPSESLPTLLIHGTRDHLVPFEGRRITPLFPRMKSVETARDYWCRAARTTSYQVDRNQPDIVRETFRGETPRQEVTLITMLGKGHGYPGQPHSIDGNPCTTLNASQEVWNFMSRHQRPQVAPPPRTLAATMR